MALRPAQSQAVPLRSSAPARSRRAGAVVDILEPRRLFTGITGLSLINTDNDTVIGPLTKDTVINSLALGTSNFTVRADADASTASVRFSLDGGNVLDSTSPFTLGGENGADYLPFSFATGSHTLLVTPYGGSAGTGLEAKAFRVTFVVDQTGVVRAPNVLPAVTLVSPTTTTTTAPGYSLLRADASDLDGFVTKVEFWSNGSLLATANNAPYLASWHDVAAGSYSVTARAYDNDGAVVETAPAVVTINAQSTSTIYVSKTGLDTNPGTQASPVLTIAKGISLATTGSTVLIGDGTYFEGLTLKKSGISLAAQNPGNVVIDGTNGATKRTTLLIPDATTPATDVRVSGIVFRNANSGGHSDSAAVRTWDRWTLTDCTVELTNGNGVGVMGSNVMLLRVTAQDNGCSGIGGTSEKNGMMLDCISRRNNTAGNSGSTEGGGGKFTRSAGLLVENYNSYQNNGPGLWFDYNNVNVVVRNSKLHENITLLNADGSDKIAGTGIFFEISGVVDDGTGVEKGNGPLLAENNLIYDNQKRGITVYASAYATIVGNTLVNNAIELKDKRPAPFSIHNLSITGNLLKNSRVLVDQYSAANYYLRQFRIDYNTYDNPTGRLWNWVSTDYNSLAPIQALGFEIHGALGSITFTPPPSPILAPSPASTSTPAPVVTKTTPVVAQRAKITAIARPVWRTV